MDKAIPNKKPLLEVPLAEALLREINKGIKQIQLTIKFIRHIAIKHNKPDIKGKNQYPFIIFCMLLLRKLGNEKGKPRLLTPAFPF